MPGPPGLTQGRGWPKEEGKQLLCNIIVACLNHVFLHRSAKPCYQSLRRRPNANQQVMHEEVRMFVSSWCRESFEGASCGRKHEALGIQLDKLTDIVSTLNLDLDAYRQIPSSMRMQSITETSKPLQSHRLQFPTDLSAWDGATYVSPHLWLAYQELFRTRQHFWRRGCRARRD